MVTKAYRAPESEPEVLLVGNSRVEMGLFPGHALFNGKAAYNIAMPGADVRMQVDYAVNTIRLTGTVKTLIIGVDILDFLVDESALAPKDITFVTPGYHKRLREYGGDSLENDLFRLREQAAMIFSLDSLIASIMTVIKQRSIESSIDVTGFNTAQSYVDIVRVEGVKALFVQKLQEIQSNLAGEKRVVVSEATGVRSPAFEHLQRLMDEARERGIEVHIFISPYHYSYLHVLDEAGLTEEFWRWKEMLIDQLNVPDIPSLPLWDFSIFSQAVLEPVPLDTPLREMEWYWEPAHYKRELGDHMLAVMLGGSSDEFAVKLTSTNIAETIERGKLDLEATKSRWLVLKHALGLDD